MDFRREAGARVAICLMRFIVTCGRSVRAPTSVAWQDTHAENELELLADFSARHEVEGET